VVWFGIISHLSRRRPDTQRHLFVTSFGYFYERDGKDFCMFIFIQVFAFYTARRRILKIAALLLNVVVIQERGARYVLIMLDEKQKKVGVIAASAGKSLRSIARFIK
jgi:hypothetical protein